MNLTKLFGWFGNAPDESRLAPEPDHLPADHPLLNLAVPPAASGAPVVAGD